MADGGNARIERYSAFISYSHFDVAFARRLHRRLESYRFPRRLDRSRNTNLRKLRPVFRDRDELTAAADLTSAVRDAVADSSYLIVVCSQHSARSEWVGREVTLFRELHGDGCILAALVEDASGDVFHPALRLSDRSSGLEPLAADFGRRRDGSRLALLKIVAVLGGVRLDELVQRDAQRRIRRAGIAGLAALTGMAMMGVLTLVAVNARATAERERARGETLIEFLLTDLRTRLKGVGRLDLLDAVNKGALDYYRGQDLSHLAEAGLLQRAKLLQAIGEDDEQRGDFAEAGGQFEEARRTTSALMAGGSNDEKRIFAQSQSEYWVGFIAWRLEEYAKAETHFKAYEDLARRLVKIAPESPDWLIEMGDAESNLGTFVLRRSLDLKRAEPFLTAALEDFRKAAKYRPADVDIQFSIADGLGWLGDVERLRKNYDVAWQNRILQQSVLQDLSQRDPRNAQIRAALIANELALARIDICRGGRALTSAIQLLIDGYRSAAELAQADPHNVYMGRQVRIFELFEARAWMMLPAETRPADTVIHTALGNCGADRKMPHSEELATFCDILHASRFSQMGDGPSERHLIATLRSGGQLQGDKLTERWGLNFSEESAAALAAKP